MNNIISLENVSFGYNKQNTLLENFNFSLNSGDFTGIIGASGAGKTTLFKVLTGLVKAKSGNVLLEGKNIRKLPNVERAKLMAVVPQEFYSPLPYTVKQIVEMGRLSLLPRIGIKPSDHNQYIEKAMTEMNVSQYSDKLFNTLSGGEKQRVRIAMALAQTPRILLLDEPTNSLDLGHSIQLMKLLKNLNLNRGISILIISHDIQLASKFCRRIVLLKNGRKIADGKTESIINSALLKEAYDCDIKVFEDSKGDKYLSFPD